MNIMIKDSQIKEPVNINVNASTFIGSTYSQLVGVTVTDVDLTLEFVYLNPRTNKDGQVVARITLPRVVGEKLSKMINETLLQHEAKKKGQN